MALWTTETAQPPFTGLSNSQNVCDISDDTLRRVRLKFLRQDAARKQRTIDLLSEMERVEERLRKSALRTQHISASKRSCEAKVAHLFHVPSADTRERTSVLPISPISRTSSVKSESRLSLICQSDNDGYEGVVDGNNHRHQHIPAHCSQSAEHGGSDMNEARESETNTEQIIPPHLGLPIEAEFQALQARSEALCRLLTSDSEWDWRLQPVTCSKSVTMLTDNVIQETLASGCAGDVSITLPEVARPNVEESASGRPGFTDCGNVDDFTSRPDAIGGNISAGPTRAPSISETPQLLVAGSTKGGASLHTDRFIDSTTKLSVSNCSDARTAVKINAVSSFPIVPPSSNRDVVAKSTDRVFSDSSDSDVPDVPVDVVPIVRAPTGGGESSADSSLDTTPTKPSTADSLGFEHPESQQPPVGSDRTPAFDMVPTADPDKIPATNDSSGGGVNAVLNSLGTINKNKSSRSSSSSSSSSPSLTADEAGPHRLTSVAVVSPATPANYESDSGSYHLSEEQVVGIESTNNDAVQVSDDDFWG